MIDLERDGDVHVLHMRAGENRFNRGFLDALFAALDEVAKSEGPAALVTTGEGKFYSNGLDLDWMSGDGAGEVNEFISDVHRMFARFLGFTLPTVAAMNGHAFAGGGMMALGHDFRVMRSDRGYFCLPEADIGMPLTPGMNALITAKLPKVTAHEAIITGRRYGAEECAAKGIVHEAVPEAEVLPRAIEIARALTGKDRGTQAALKHRLYEAELAILEG
ncbi:MAG: enoyl-CoA hydratase/isomerase family protein [Deltaproteobacteria bacterium]|nr:enoyl-CoA hydratase/isomerase family protein [Deltaproteobacteria bacterium]MBW2445772.1 enoyl-CoA hydratase/isomerase family protein [Deltaproteobacteria bacterium]